MIEEYSICHNCGNMVYPVVESREFHLYGLNYTISDHTLYRCDKCEREWYSASECKRIYDILNEEYCRQKRGEINDRGTG